MEVENWDAVMEEHGGLDRYLDCMSHKGSSHDKKTWGDGIILEAAAYLYGHPISVQSQDTAAVISIKNDKCCDSAVCTIGIVDNCHYVSLKPIAHSDTVLPNAPVVTLPNVVVTPSPLSADIVDTEKNQPKHSLQARADKETDGVVRDIGLYAGADAQCQLNTLSDGDKADLLERHWTPPLNYKMPYSTRTIRGKEEKRYLRHEHFDRCKFLAFSECRQGLFCKVCVLFGPKSAGRNQSHLNRLVSIPLTKYDRLFGANGYLTSHENAEYHKTSVVRATSFLASMTKHTDICTSLDNARNQQVEENRGSNQLFLQLFSVEGKI